MAKKIDPLYVPREIRTVNGKYVNVFDPNLETLYILDIAHALSMQPRYGGHCPVFYSVAEHCLWMVKKMFEAGNYTKEEIFAALMHDSSEAYLVDIPKPIKLQLPDYNKVEDTVMNSLAVKFNFAYPLPNSVKEWDVKALEWEWEFLVNDDPVNNENYPKTLSQKEAYFQFLLYWRMLSPRK